jgi:hypothetical protein
VEPLHQDTDGDTDGGATLKRDGQMLNHRVLVVAHAVKVARPDGYAPCRTSGLAK